MVMCGIDYPHIIQDMQIGFPVVDVKSEFHSPFRYGDTIHATIWISKVGVKSCTCNTDFTIKMTTYCGLVNKSPFVLV